jgi:hypothetical protein
MSSRGSDAILVDLPQRLWADRLSDLVGLLAAGVLAWVSVGGGLFLPWLAVILASGLATWCLARRSVPSAGRLEVVPGAATRRLGRVLLIDVRPAGSDGPCRRACLTRGDLSARQLRHLSLRLRAGQGKAGS